MTMITGKTIGKMLLTGTGAALLTFLNLGTALSAPLSLKDEPLFLNEVPPPLNMLVMSRDHRMYYEAYNDASDLDGDGTLDVTYKTDARFSYYGYFDSYRCYTYASGVFSPAGATATKKCSGQWSGDWLNYVTMSRIDALRKVLYGGLRSTDTATQTILQRAYIPQDAHSWGKEYTSVAVNGYDIAEYTPLAQPAAGTRHLFANTTPSADAATTGNGNAAINGVALPKLRVLQSKNNRIWDWVSKERPVADAGFSTGLTDYIVRVEVCGTGTFESDPRTNCKVYGSGSAKPTGLLQDYGENNSMYFGLLAGSYGKPHDGGVLRKAVSSLQNEINLSTGQFYQNLTPPGIINTIDRLRITGFNNDVYACGWITTSSDNAGACSMWGNPTAEMMYEVARYYAGKTTSTGSFSSGANNAEETSIGLSVANWDGNTNPYRNGGYPHCAKPFETVISDISPSYDSDTVPGSNFTGYSGDIAMNAANLGQTIWNHEIGASGRYFIGQSGAVYDGAPTAKTVTSFGNIRGLAPEAPAKEGSYNSAAVAYYALQNDLNPATGDQKMQTFAVALASPLPRIDIPVGDGRITMVPFAKSVGGGYGIDASQGAYQPTNQIVDFYVDTITPTYGKFRVNFEDVEQGADHDMDAIAIYEYTVNAGSVTITVTSEYAAGGIIQHMGYVISGSTQDGTYLVVRDVDTAAGSDVDYFLDTPAGQPPGGTWTDGQPLPAGAANPVSRTFSPGSTAAAGILKDPLYYAAKWGGFDDSKGVADGLPSKNAGANPEWDSDNDGVPDNYFLVTNALRLKQQLGQAFSSILDKAASASAASVSSGSINSETRLFQATFDARYWGGHLLAYEISDGTDGNPVGSIKRLGWDAGAPALLPPSSRAVITVDATPAAGTTGVYRTGRAFQWGSIGAARQAQLNGADTNGPARLAWLRGSRAGEGAGLRRRGDTVLGDIVNSSPVYVAAPFNRYPANLESVPYSTFRNGLLDRPGTVYVGANDGMLHAFDVETGAERFAFIPHSVFRNLRKLTDPAYTHQYYVDGTPSIIDAFYNSGWHSVLVAGLNKGGQGIYALDVTHPELIAESSASSTFLWEFTDAEDADLGYTYSRPSIVRLHNGRWAAVFGNGYNNTDSDGGADTNVSTTGNAVLYIVDIETGALLRKFDTGAGMAQDPKAQSRPNGLASPTVIDINNDAVMDYVYAGDLFGNMWKIDLTDVNPAAWDFSYRESGTNRPLPLFKAVNGAGIPQPITERAQVSRGPSGVGAVVLFGTGKFLEAADRDVSTLSVQSFYGIYDKMTGTDTDRVLDNRSTLVRQTITKEAVETVNGTPRGIRVTSNTPVDPAAKSGWYIDLVSPSAGFQGEMQITDAVLRDGAVLFTTLIPDPDICAFGGRSWLMSVNAATGSRLRDSFIGANDSNGDPISGINADAIMYRPALLDTESAPPPGPGNDPNDPPPPPPPPLCHTVGHVPLSNATTETVDLCFGTGASGRQSWRQLR